MAHVCSGKSIREQNSNFAANVENRRFGGQSILIDLSENNKVANTKVTKLKGENQIVKNFNLDKLVKSRKKRFSDSNNFK